MCRTLPPPPLPWRSRTTRVMVSSFLMRFLDHTQRRTTVGRTPLDEWSDRRRDLYLTTHNTHNRQIFMPPAGFEPTISAGERSQTYALDRAATGTGKLFCLVQDNLLSNWGKTSESTHCCFKKISSFFCYAHLLRDCPNKVIFESPLGLYKKIYRIFLLRVCR